MTANKVAPQEIHVIASYPPPGVSTSNGGEGGICPTPSAPVEKHGLLDQTAAGQPLGNQLDDARLSRDEGGRTYAEDMRRQGQGINAGGLTPYGDSAAKCTKSDMENMHAEGVKAKTYNDEI